MNWISLAFRNLLRNSRRSITTIAAVALGYAAVNVFGGFASYMFASIREAYVYDQASGHIQIWKNGAQTYGGSDPGAFLLTAQDYADLQAFAAEHPGIDLAAGMLEVKGQLDANGPQGFFISWAMPPSARTAIRERAVSLKSLKSEDRGEPITDDTPLALGVTSGIMKNMKLEIGDDVVLMAPTVQGQMNAVEPQVRQVIDMPSKSLNNRFIFMPLELAQYLYGTDGVSSVRLLLKKTGDTDRIVAELNERFANRDWEVLPWHEAAQIYRSTKRMFDMIFGLVFAIIITIVTMSVLNTIGMAVVERTTEIGTLRALGLKRPGVIRLFGIESALLGIIGAVLGLGLTMAISLAIAAAGPMWEPPMSSREVLLQIPMVPFFMTATFFALVAFTFCAAYLPARRASRQSIVDALGHV